jgi:hypothetical protein
MPEPLLVICRAWSNLDPRRDSDLEQGCFHQSGRYAASVTVTVTVTAVGRIKATLTAGPPFLAGHHSDSDFESANDVDTIVLRRIPCDICSV